MARKDPFANFKFEVESGGFPAAGFKSISGIEADVEVIEYREGGDNETMRKQAGQTTFSDITLERGFSNNEDLINWLKRSYDINSIEGNQLDNETLREDVVIFVKDKAGVRSKKITIYEAFVRNYALGDLDAEGNDILIETVVLANEGFRIDTL